MSQISDVFTRGQTVYYLPNEYKVLPSPSTFKPRVSLWAYADEVLAVLSTGVSLWEFFDRAVVVPNFGCGKLGKC
jgi:hypothetical protein